MKFNLTIQQAIDAMMTDHICVCADDYMNDPDRIYRIFKSKKEYEYYFESKIKNINEEWKPCDLKLYQITSKWAIYEKPKKLNSTQEAIEHMKAMERGLCHP